MLVETIFTAPFSEAEKKFKELQRKKEKGISYNLTSTGKKVGPYGNRVELYRVERMGGKVKDLEELKSYGYKAWHNNSLRDQAEYINKRKNEWKQGI